MVGGGGGFGEGAPGLRAEEEMMSYRAEYGPLLEAIAREADAIAMKYFHADEMRVERKGDGTVVTQADRAVEEIARGKVAGSRLAIAVLGEEKSEDQRRVTSSLKREDVMETIEGTEGFSHRHEKFWTLLEDE